MAAPATAASLGFREKLAYGLGDTASNLFFQAFNLFLFYYYTDVFGLPAAAVGTMMVFARLVDAVSDPLVGILADRTATRWGRFRPWILFGAVPYGVLGCVMFANPALGETGKLVFAYVTYSAMWIAYTVVNIPYSALLGVMSASSVERCSLSTYRFACAFSGGLVIASLTLPLKDWLGGGDPADGFRDTMALFAVVSVALFLFTFASTRERVQPPAEQDPSLRRDLQCLFANGPWLVLCVAALFTLANVGVRNAAGIYYFKYNVGDEAGFTAFGTAGMLAFVAGAFATKLFTRCWSRRSLMIGLMAVNGLAMAAFFVADPQHLPTLHALNIVGAFAAGPTPAIVWSMYADTADYGEWRFGRRATGLVFSAVVFAQKVGLALGSGLLGWALTAYGFVPNVPQSPESLLGIKLMFSVVPGGLALLAGAAFCFYPLDEPLVRRIEEELAARRSPPAPVPAVVPQTS